MFDHKKILYIGPRFFGYELEIIQTLKELGMHVDFFDDRPANDFWTKLFIRLKLDFFVKRKIDQYYEKIYKFIRGYSYDFVFVIAPETLNYDKLCIIKKLQPNAKYILYMWDSFQNKNSFNTIELFDRVLTFDSNDSVDYQIEFLPLFYIRKYEEISHQINPKNDLCFVGTAHSDRYKVAKAIERQLNENKFEMFSFFFLPNHVIYWFRKLFMKSFRYGNISDFSFRSLSQDDIINIFQNSKAVLDINHPRQFGLTSRSIEALGARRKLITTNPNIKKYDFYNQNNVLVIDRNNPKIDYNFFDTSYADIDESIYRKYSLKNWILNIFELNS